MPWELYWGAVSSALPNTPTSSDGSLASAAEPDRTLPRWVPWLIALTPVVPPLYVAAFGALGRLRELPVLLQRVLMFYVAAQLLAAVFTPSPLLSVPLAGARALLILAMIAAGVYLRDARTLRPMVWGYLIVFATAWAFSLIEIGPQAIQSRLGHPFYYIVSLGLLGVIALWMIVSWKGASPWWRFPAGAFALATIIAAGSRGPLLALAVGALAAVAAGSYRYLRALALLAVIGAAAFGLVPQLRNLNPLERLATINLSGRDEVWQGAIHAFRASPLGGQGPYQLGPYLTYLYKDGCHLNPTLEQAGYTCPAWLERFSGAWLIAHNAFLHSLGEAGIIGTLGLGALFLAGAVAVWRTRNGLLLSIFWGFTAMNFVDVVTTVPSPHFAELFWVVVGIAFYRSAASNGAAPTGGAAPN